MYKTSRTERAVKKNQKHKINTSRRQKLSGGKKMKITINGRSANVITENCKCNEGRETSNSHPVKRFWT